MSSNPLLRAREGKKDRETKKERERKRKVERKKKEKGKEREGEEKREKGKLIPKIDPNFFACPKPVILRQETNQVNNVHTIKDV